MYNDQLFRNISVSVSRDGCFFVCLFVFFFFCSLLNFFAFSNVVRKCGCTRCYEKNYQSRGLLLPAMYRIFSSVVRTGIYFYDHLTVHFAVRCTFKDKGLRTIICFVFFQTLKNQYFAIFYRPYELSRIKSFRNTFEFVVMFT